MQHGFLAAFPLAFALMASNVALSGRPAQAAEGTRSAQNPSGGPATIEFERAENGAIYFKVPEGSPLPSAIKAELYDLKWLGRIQSGGEKPPYFVFVGKPCQDCTQETAVYLVRPGDPKPSMFVQPGRILDTKTRQVVLESRAFFGRCLGSRKNEVYVVFQKERVDRRKKLQASVFLAEPRDEFLEEKLIERGLPNINDTLRLVKKKSCREIEGRNRVNTRKLLDTRRGARQEEDDDESN